jgi:hypothetical protein
MNGTGLKTLREGYDLADDKLHDFLEAWQRMEFNARDYYTQGPEHWQKATEARQEINAKLREVKGYLDAHREHLYSIDR